MPSANWFELQIASAHRSYSESATSHGRLGFPADHPLYGQSLPLWSPEVRPLLAEFDVVFVAGMDLLRQYVYHEPARAVPEHVKIVHLDESPWQIGKNYPVEVGLIGDTKAGLAELAAGLESIMTAAQNTAASERGRRRREAHAQARAAIEARIPQERELQAVDESDADVDAGQDSSGRCGRRGRGCDDDQYALRAAWCPEKYNRPVRSSWLVSWLGIGLRPGGQIGLAGRPVLAMLGEGAAMYGIQGLWTAARYRLPVTFVICNNAQYQILKVGARQLELPAARDGRFVGLGYCRTRSRFSRPARSLGVEAQRSDRARPIGGLGFAIIRRRCSPVVRRADPTRHARTFRDFVIATKASEPKLAKNAKVGSKRRRSKVLNSFFKICDLGVLL